MIASTRAPAPERGEFNWLEWSSWRALMEEHGTDLMWEGALLVGVILAALLVHAILFAVLRVLASRTPWKIDDVIVRHLRWPGRLLLPLLGIMLVLPGFDRLGDAEVAWIRHLLSLITIAAVAWLLIACVRALEENIKAAHDVAVADNLAARRVHTQISVLARTLTVFVIIVAAAAALMTFPRIREIGAGLLVSAGFAGLAVGLAARPVLENLIAGIQIALTQPIRIDDVVIMDGEFGRIEEITTTYVVVRVWDDRRIIAPFSKFMTDSFQNWTRRTAQLLGTVLVYADYSLPVQPLREEFDRIVEQSDLWDRRVKTLQVTDLTEQTIQMRALVSAANADKAWNLRVLVREKLIEFLQSEYPQCLPRTRVELDARPAAANGGSSARPAL